TEGCIQKTTWFIRSETLENRRSRVYCFCAVRSYHSNSRSNLKILYNLCRQTLSAPFRAPCIAFDAPCTARIEARRVPPQLWGSMEAEFHHGHGTRGATCLELRGALTGIERQGGS